MASTGVVAGVGIGSGIAGLIIGVIACFLYFRRRQSSRGRLDPNDVIPEDPKSTPPVIYEHYLELWQNNLVRDFPQHLYGAQIREEIRDINHWISHFGHDINELSSPRPKLDKSRVIKLIGPDNADHADELVELIETADQKTALKAVRIIFGMAILSQLDPNGDPETTLLPPDLLRFYQGLPNRDTSHLARAALFKDCWRNLTSLIYIGFPQIEIPEDDMRREHARNLSANITEMLQPFLRTGKFGGSPQALETFILVIAEHGFTLFSQQDAITTGWKDLWAEDKEDGERKLIMFPAYYQNLRNRHPANAMPLGGSEMHQRSDNDFHNPMKWNPKS